MAARTDGPVAGVSVGVSVERFPSRIRSLPEVLECCYLTGEIDYLLKVVVATHRILKNDVSTHVARVHTARVHTV